MEFKGRAASVGTVTATARVLTDVKEAETLNEGDILITKMTTPEWTHLFSKLGGVVTEVGGILSHPAIIARETGIPAVVSVPNATQIPDGSRVFLDGRAGIVRVLDGQDN
ncbi:MAG: PEP-utilizing enzyme [Candidatus Thorarchaeota archaeon]|jgi:pyruvate,water dikinase